MPPSDQRTGALLAAVQRWNATHAPAQDIDPAAELAVARQEGLSGGIGDNGHAFGPNQANDAGGVLTGKLAGLTPQQKNAWAWSPQGLAFQLAGVAGVAGGQHGAQAVANIVRRYERPADPGGELARALQGFGGSSSVGGGAAPAAGGAPAADPNARRQAILSLINSVGSPGGDVTSFLQDLKTSRAAGGVTTSLSSGAGASGQNPGLPSGHGGLAELLREGTGGPTHSTGPHIHAAFNDPQTELRAIQWAQQHDLSIRENPYVGDTVDPVHAPNSYHGRTFPGLFNGRKLGQAIDVSGPNADAFYSLLAGRR